MDDRIVLNVAVRSDLDAVIVRPKDCMGPYADPVSKDDVSENDCRRIDVELSIGHNN
jgi:hypothetical protein